MHQHVYWKHGIGERPDNNEEEYIEKRPSKKSATLK